MWIVSVIHVFLPNGTHVAHAQLSNEIPCSSRCDEVLFVYVFHLTLGT